MPLPNILAPVHRSLDSLKRQQGNSEFFRDYLASLSLDHAAVWDDDFQGDTLHGGYQTAADAGATALAITAPTSAVRHGRATMVTGATSDEQSIMSLGLHYYGENGAVMYALVALSAITTVKVEIGFSDQTASTTTPAIVNSLSGETATATDGACWIFDTADSGNVGWQGFGVANGTVAAKYEPTVINYDGDNDPNAGEYELFSVELRGSSARFRRGDFVSSAGTDLARKLTMTADSGWLASMVTATVALTPHVLVQCRTTSSRTLTLDAFGARQWRFTAE